MKNNKHPSIFKRIKIKYEKKFGRSGYGTGWQGKSDDLYTKQHKQNYLIHEDFVNYIKNLDDVETVLEIGCGTGVYPIDKKEVFAGKKYTGMDISQSSIDYCKNKSDFNFICGDFLKLEFNSKFDLVFSHAVIDHVYDINLFISKIADITNKHAYINSYRGYYPDLENHKSKWDGHLGFYFNNLSVKEIDKNLLEQGLSKDEFKIRKQKSGQPDPPLDYQTIIQINKKTQKK